MIDYLWCKDIDECAYDETIDPLTLLKVKTATGTNKCPSVELCQNKIGSYECICSSSDGYQPNPADCEPLLKPDACACQDYDECTNNLHDCTQSMRSLFCQVFQLLFSLY